MQPLTKTELAPLHEVRLAAEQHLGAIRELYRARVLAKNRDAADTERLTKVNDVIAALEEVQRNVTELEEGR